MVWIINAIIERADDQTTLVLVPLNILIQQHIDTCHRYGLTAHKWEGETTAKADVVFAICEAITKPYLVQWLHRIHTAHHHKDGISRICLDEGQYIPDNPDFRPGLRAMPVLQTLGYQLVLLTATLPPADVPRISQLCGLGSPRVIRAPTSRPNIQYRAVSLPRTVNEEDPEVRLGWVRFG